MARVNVDDNIETKSQFFSLLDLVGGDRDRALGKLVRFFRITQGPWSKGIGVSQEELEAEGLGEMLSSGWAVPFADGFTAKGADSHFAWLLQKKKASNLGGEANRLRLESRAAIAREPPDSRREPSDSPLALALSLAPTLKARKSEEGECEGKTAAASLLFPADAGTSPPVRKQRAPQPTFDSTIPIIQEDGIFERMQGAFPDVPVNILEAMFSKQELVYLSKAKKRTRSGVVAWVTHFVSNEVMRWRQLPKAREELPQEQGPSKAEASQTMSLIERYMNG